MSSDESPIGSPCSYSGLSRVSQCEEAARENPSRFIAAPLVDLLLDWPQSCFRQSQPIDAAESKSLLAPFVGRYDRSGSLRLPMDRRIR